MSVPSDSTDRPATSRAGESGTPPKVVIVTGASQGIGVGVVDGFRRAGYAVVATSRSIVSSDASDVLTVRGDITDAETAQMVVHQAVDRFGRIDSLINNAGIFISKPFTDYTSDDYQAITAVNLTGFFHITQCVIGQMLTQNAGGHIVNITTSLVDHAESRNPSALVSLTKGGLAAVSRSLAIEYAFAWRARQRSRPRRHTEPGLRSCVIRGHGRPTSTRSARPDQRCGRRDSLS